MTIATVAALALIAPVGLTMAFQGLQGVLTFLLVVAGSLGLVLAAVAVTNPLLTRLVSGTAATVPSH